MWCSPCSTRPYIRPGGHHLLVKGRVVDRVYACSPTLDETTQGKFPSGLGPLSGQPGGSSDDEMIGRKRKPNAVDDDELRDRPHKCFMILPQWKTGSYSTYEMGRNFYEGTIKTLKMGMRLGTTQNGNVGWFAKGVRPGDVVAVLFGWM